METHNQDKPQSSAHINDKNKIIINNNNNGDANLTQFVPLDLSGGGDDHDKNVAAGWDDSAIRSKERI